MPGCDVAVGSYTDKVKLIYEKILTGEITFNSETWDNNLSNDLDTLQQVLDKIDNFNLKEYQLTEEDSKHLTKTIFNHNNWQKILKDKDDLQKVLDKIDALNFFDLDKIGNPEAGKLPKIAPDRGGIIWVEPENAQNLEWGGMQGNIDFQTDLDVKFQHKLSDEHVKTINHMSLVGSGNIDMSSTSLEILSDNDFTEDLIPKNLTNDDEITFTVAHNQEDIEIGMNQSLDVAFPTTITTNMTRVRQTIIVQNTSGYVGGGVTNGIDYLGVKIKGTYLYVVGNTSNSGTKYYDLETRPANEEIVFDWNIGNGELLLKVFYSGKLQAIYSTKNAPTGRFTINQYSISAKHKFEISALSYSEHIKKDYIDTAIYDIYKRERPTELKIPANFKVYKKPLGRKFFTNYEPSSPLVQDAFTATIFVDVAAINSLELGTKENPLLSLNKAAKVGANTTKLLIIAKGGEYYGENSFYGIKPTNDIISIISEDKKEVISSPHITDDFEWVNEGDNTYSTTVPANAFVFFDEKNIDNFGDFKRILGVNSLEDCKSTANSSFVDGTTLYVYLFDEREPDNKIRIYPFLSNLLFDHTSKQEVYLENIKMLGGIKPFSMRGDHGNIVVAKDCDFSYGAVNNYQILGNNSSYLVRCKTVHAGADGFAYTNYIEGGAPDAIEIDCEARENGYLNDHSNNGSTIHAETHMIRVNGKYHNNQHKNIHDVSNSLSWNLGVNAYHNKEGGASNWRCSFSGKMWLDYCDSADSDNDIIVDTVGTFIYISNFTGDSTNIKNSGGIIEHYTPESEIGSKIELTPDDLQNIINSLELNIDSILNLQDRLNEKANKSQVLTDVPLNAVFTDTVTQIINNLTSASETAGVSANQARLLKEMIDNINTILLSDDMDLDQIQELVLYIKQNRSTLEALSINNIAGLPDALNLKVDKDGEKGLSDENFTSLEKTKISQQSGINTGDQDLTGLQQNLVSGENIKTINNISILGSGNVDIGESDSAQLTSVKVASIYPDDGETNSAEFQTLKGCLESLTGKVEINVEEDMFVTSDITLQPFVNLTFTGGNSITFKLRDRGDDELSYWQIKGTGDTFIKPFYCEFKTENDATKNIDKWERSACIVVKDGTLTFNPFWTKVYLSETPDSIFLYNSTSSGCPMVNILLYPDESHCLSRAEPTAMLAGTQYASGLYTMVGYTGSNWIKGATAEQITILTD